MLDLPPFTLTVSSERDLLGSLERLLAPFSLFLLEELRWRRDFSLDEFLLKLGLLMDSALTLRPVAVKATSVINIAFSIKFIHKNEIFCTKLPILPDDDRLERRMCIAVGSLSLVNFSPTGVKNHSDLVRILAVCLSCT